MYRKLGMDIEEFLEYCSNNRSFPRFKGLEPFRELIRRDRIAPFVTTIRIMYSGPIDQCNCLDNNGMLQSINNPEKEPQKPEEVLSEEKNPDGWEIELLKPKHFDV